MKRKNIDAMREIRLWIGQVIVPAAGLGTLLATNTEARNSLKKVGTSLRNYTKSVFAKKGDK